MSSHANRNMCQVPGGRSRRMDCCYYYLELIFRVAILYTCCSLLPSATLAQTTSAASGGGFHSPGNQRVNSLVTSERSTSYPDLARDFQQTTPQNHAATAWTPSSSRTIADNSLITAATTTGASTALGAIVHATSLAPVPTQPKHLKFTLIAGKYWKFNIKTNSLQASHGERELRLHGNDSARNFIIDDDGWFQYNHQQQQLFAWPSLSVKSATYNFVLLPSGIDYEADSENGLIKPSDVAANIVVEVIRPYTGSNAPSSRFDIDQLIDHKFSLEYLHRHSSYPLLLSQIVSVFDIIARTNSINTRNTLSSQSSDSATSVSRATTPPQQSSTSTSSSITALLQQTKQTKLLSNKLIEFLLIDSSATADGEYFSLTWTSHPSLVNNTVHPINECRLQSINETISRLSSRSIVYSSSADDKYVIPYSLDSPLANTQSIIPTERGNYALKLSLLHPCRDKHVFEELGVSPTAQELPTSGIDYRVNDLPDLSTVDTTTETSALEPSKETNTSSSVSTSSNGPIEISAGESTDSLPGELLERGQTNHGVTELKSWPVAVESPRPFATSEPPRPLTTREPPIAAIYDQTITSHRPNSPKILLKSTQLPQELLIATTTRPSNSSISADQIVATPPTQIYRPTDSINTQPSTAEQAAAGQSSPPAFERTQHAPTQAQINTRRAIESTVPSIPPSPSINFKHHPETNSDPQAGSSLANPLDLQIDIKPKTIMSQVNPPVTTNVPITNANIPLGTTSNIIPATVTNATNASTGNPTPIASKSDQETSLNDDLIGILNEVMEYLVSVAVPLSIILGVILIASIFIAICNLCAKRRKAKRFETDDRFKFRYGSERKMFLKNRSKPVILEADQKSLSMGGTPQHKPLMTPLEKDGDSKKKGKKKGAQSKHNDKSSGRSNFFDMHLFPSTGNYDMGGSSGGAGHGGGGGFLGGDCGDGGGFSGGDCGDGGGGDCGGCD